MQYYLCIAKRSVLLPPARVFCYLAKCSAGAGIFNTHDREPSKPTQREIRIAGEHAAECQKMCFGAINIDVNLNKRPSKLISRMQISLFLSFAIGRAPTRSRARKKGDHFYGLVKSNYMQNRDNDKNWLTADNEWKCWGRRARSVLVAPAARWSLFCTRARVPLTARCRRASIN